MSETPGHQSVAHTEIEPAGSIADQLYLVLDTFLYYIINMVVLILNLTENVGEISEKVAFNYQIIYSSFKHKIYNNIN